MALLQGESVRQLFDSISPSYDLFNSLASFGRDRYWRKKAIELLQPGFKVLDVGCGTGDMTFEAARYLGNDCVIHALDFSDQMLKIAEGKAETRSKSCSIEWICDSITNLPNSRCGDYDAIISGFVMRNLHDVIQESVRSMFRSLKPGGILSVVDLTEPNSRFLRLGSKIHMNTCITLFGLMCFGKMEPVRHLHASMKHFFRAHEFKVLLELAGFQGVTATSYCFGAVTHYTAYKQR